MSQENQQEVENEIRKEPLNHYYFSLQDLALNRFDLSPEQVKNYKLLLLTGLAEEIAKEMHDDWLISHGNDLNVVLYDKNHATKEHEDKIIKYYEKNGKIPEDTLYLSNESIELYSRNVRKIEEHKARLEILSENIGELILHLKELDKEDKDPEEREINKIETIMNHLKEERNKIDAKNEMNAKKNKLI